jgi:glycosyltransferase involved in cell wall biosynthesis
MRLLVLTTDYPNNEGDIKLAYVHARNLYYIRNGHFVTVLNFSAKKGYCIDNINVITYAEYRKGNSDLYDLVICHAPNLRNHYTFLKQHSKNIKRLVFFYHGHEVFLRSKVYSPSFSFFKKPRLFGLAEDLYDYFKLFVWRRYLPKIAYKSWFIFVSEWMRSEFFKWTKIKSDIIEKRSSIIYNCISRVFATSQYDRYTHKEYDFITIRANMDESKYGVDIVNKLAEANPKLRFLVVGKGRIFSHIAKAENLHWMDQNLRQEEIIKLLNMARCALMPTRTDSQGVMACEIASFGMPMITSNIPVSKEIFSQFKNVNYMDNEKTNQDMEALLHATEQLNYVENNIYHEESTIGHELSIFNSL